MRKTLLVLAVFALTGSLLAADPIVGTWKVNVAKSNFGPGVQAPIKEQTNIVQEAGPDRYEVIVTGILTNGAGFSYKAAYPKQGGATIGAQTMQSVLTILAPGDWCFTSLQDGKQTGVNRVVVGKDGKSAVQTGLSLDATGKLVEGMLFFEKQ